MTQTWLKERDARKTVGGPSKKGWEGRRGKCQVKTRKGQGIQGGQMKDLTRARYGDNRNRLEGLVVDNHNIGVHLDMFLGEGAIMDLDRIVIRLNPY